MACNLDKLAVTDLILELYDDINSRIDGRLKSNFNLKEFSISLFNDIVDKEAPAEALTVIQAIPSVLHKLISNNESIRNYFLDNDIPRDYFKEDRDFEDLMKVADYVQTLTFSYDVIVADIEKTQEKRNNTYARFVERKEKETALSPSPLVSTFMPYKPEDPKAEKAKNELDPEKVYISNVMSRIVELAKTKATDAENIVYQDTPITLRVVPITELNPDYLVSYDTTFMEKEPAKAATILALVITDLKGNLLFFNKDNFDLETSKNSGNGLVYQQMYKVKKAQSGFELLNRSNEWVAVMSPEALAKKDYDQVIKDQKLNAFQLLDWEKKEGKKIKANILEEKKKAYEKQLTGLYNLQTLVLSDPEGIYLVDIDNGTFGPTKTQFFPLSETNFQIDGPMIEPQIAGQDKGYVRLPVKYTNEKGVETKYSARLQRGNVTEELIEKIATVITTNAKLKGSTLTRRARQEYADIMVTGVPNNQISLILAVKEGVEQLTLRLGKNGVYINEDNLYTEQTKQKIIEHLTNLVELDNGQKLNANINIYSNKINQDFTDYNIEGNVITTEQKSYNDFIKPFLSVEVSTQSGQVWGSRNPQIAFSISEDITDLNLKAADTTETDIKDEDVFELSESSIVGQLNFLFKKGDKRDLLTTNINSSDAVINIASNFNKKDEATWSQTNAGNKHIPIKIAQRKTIINTVANGIAKKLNDLNASVINITGNNLFNLRQGSKSWTQKTVDEFVYSLLSKVLPRLNVEESEVVILTTGETAVSEAAIKAAKKLGVTVEVTIPGNYRTTGAKLSKGKIIKVNNQGKDAFLERFENKKRVRKKKNVSGNVGKQSFKSKKTTGNKKRYYKKSSGKTSKAKSKRKPKTKSKKQTFDPVKAAALLKAQTEQVKKRDEKRNIYDEGGLERSKSVGSFFDRIFTTKSQKDKAKKWWNEQSNLAGTIPLEVITEIVNSNAFATWSKYGITLYQADGGTSIDLYHEAWHGFTQLYLTNSEKEDLYESIQDIPKYSKLEFEDIEELLAEEFRTFGKRQSTTLGKVAEVIFKKIRQFFQSFFGAFGLGGKVNILKLRDLPHVNDLFNKLYKGEILDLKPSLDNIMFEKLNRSKSTIQLTEKESENYEDFSISETRKTISIIDNIIGQEIRYESQVDQTGATTKKLLDVTKNKLALYDQVYEVLVEKRDQIDKSLDSFVIKTEEDQFVFEELYKKVNYLNKVLSNFGDPALSVEGKQRKGVVAFHLESSIFGNIKQLYKNEIAEEEDIEESQSVLDMQQYGDEKTNKFNPKTIASGDTVSLLSSIPKVEKTSKGEFVEVTDEFGFVQLENPEIMFHKVSKVLQGSVDYSEAYQRLLDNSLNYPQFFSLLKFLRKPGEPYKTNAQFALETSFVQDLTKPRIQFKNLNITKKIDKRGSVINETESTYNYELGVANASFSTRNVIRDWISQWFINTPDTNSYVELDAKFGNPILLLDKVVKDFGISGRFNSKKSLEFLKAIGFPMDETSFEIRQIASQPEAFANAFKLDLVYETIKVVNDAAKSDSLDKQSEAANFALNPIYFIRKGIAKGLRTKELRNTDIANRINLLAQLQVEYSDKYSNFSTLLPTDDRVWEQQHNSVISKNLQAINTAENWQQLTGGNEGTADPKRRYQHMYWLNESNNTFSKRSVLLNGVFYFDTNRYGDRRPEGRIDAINVGGTKLIDESNFRNTIGAKTSSLDGTTKFIQETNSMLLSGVEEFMRHASKNTAGGILAENIKTSSNKKDKHLYIDIEAFKADSIDGVTEGLNIVENYLFGEIDRIFRYSKNKNEIVGDNSVAFKDIPGYSKQVLKKNKANPTEFVDAGSAFTAFDDMLSWETQAMLYDVIETAIKNDEVLNIDEFFDKTPSLRDAVRIDLTIFFGKETDQNMILYKQGGYFAQSLIDRVNYEGANQENINRTLLKAYTYNSFIHKFETTILGYGDVVQYNHAKEEFHKRNTFLATSAKTLRSDEGAIEFASNRLRYLLSEKEDRVSNPIYDGTLGAAILEEKVIKKSIYYDEYLDHLTNFYFKVLKDKPKAKALAKKELEPYLNIEEGDGQGFVTLEYYRLMQYLVGEWTVSQEDLYKKIVNEEELKPEDITEMFPPLKYQYSGNLKTNGLPVTSLHKFSLAPLIPGMMGNSNLNNLYDTMMDQGVAYATFQTGSKINQMGTGDNIFNEDGTYNKDVTLTKNVIYGAYLKSQVNVNKSFKGENVFSTQARKLTPEGLFDKGRPQTPRGKAAFEKYQKALSDYTDIVEYQLLEEIGFYKDDKGKYYMKNKSSMANLVSLVRNSLTKQDIVGNHLIDIIDVTNNDNLSLDISVHPQASRIEKLILSEVNKKIIKQKFNGEPLVQQTAALMEGLFSLNQDLSKASEEVKKELKGSNFLPTYHQTKRAINDKLEDVTAATKVVITLQGDYVNLLNLEYNGETIGTDDINESVKRLNQAIKDPDFVKQYRKQLTVIGVRIPVGGLEQMEFAEIFHFLPPGSANVIISASELVSKGGGDFDVDKLNIYMMNIAKDGKLFDNSFNINEIKELAKEGLLDLTEVHDQIELQKKVLQNEIIFNMRKILELPENFMRLITPSSTSILEPIADEIAPSVRDYDNMENLMSDTKNYMLKDGKKVIVQSPTRVFSTRYNVNKSVDNSVGKRTLGLGAIENIFNTLLTQLGGYMPDQFFHGKETTSRKSHLFLRHNKVKINSKGDILQNNTKRGKEVISISNLFDVDGLYRVGAKISQAMNGWVDVEKKAWIANIQGNYEVAPILLYLFNAGVSAEEAIYFVSNPLVREYVKRQQLAKSPVGELIGTKPKDPKFGVKYPSASFIINQLDDVLGNTNKLIKNRDRFDKGVNTALDYFTSKGRSENEFTLDEMKDLIQADKNNLTFNQKKLAGMMFLHFLAIEQQTDALTQLKIYLNPDTRTRTAGSELEQSELNIQNLENNTKLMPGLIKKFKNDSVISSFFKNDLSTKILQSVMPLRYNQTLINYMQSITKTDLERFSMAVYGKKDIEGISTLFRDEFINYLYQNTVRKLDIADGYGNYTFGSKTYKPKKAIELKFGAFVKDGQLYIDEKVLRKEFREGKWKDTDRSDGNYDSRGLFSLAPSTFTNGETNYNQYLSFVLERETLRSIMPKKDLTDTKEFKDELKITKEIRRGFSQEKAVNYTYEKMLAHKALFNTLNPYHLFFDPKYSYAVKLTQMLLKYKNELANYDVLNILSADKSISDEGNYLFTTEKDFSNDLSNLYFAQLTDLADPSVKKVPNREDNALLSTMFSQFSSIGFLQTGLTGGKYNLTQIINPSDYIFAIQARASEFNDLLNKGDITEILKSLDRFKDKFEELNIKNKKKKIFKDYVVKDDILNVSEKIKKDEVKTIPFSVGNVRKIGLGEKTTTVRSESNEIETGTYRIGGKLYTLTNIGNLSVEEAGGKARMIATEGLPTRKTKANKFPVESEGVTYYAQFERTVKWLEGGSDPLNVIQIEPLEGDAKTLYLQESPVPGVEFYDSTKNDKEYYDTLAEQNPDKVFVYGYFLSNVNKNFNYYNEGFLHDSAEGMSIGLPIGEVGYSDMFDSFPPRRYDELIKYWENKFNEIDSLLSKGNTVVFPKGGLATASMPSELFVYLSNKLVKYGLLNPGSTQFKDVQETLGNVQGITDAEIIEELGLDEDPFVCPT